MSAATETQSSFNEKLDPITFEVLRNALSGVVDEMAVMLEKVAFSTVVSEGRDFSGAICTPTGELVCQGDQDLPFLGGTIPFRVKAVVDTVGDDVSEGDLFLHNDPYMGGSHAQDVSMVAPVFWEGRLFAWIQTAAHWPDLGGSMPGSYDSEATSSFEEALMIPPVHLVRKGVLQEDILRLILRNLRVPDVVRGDIRAMQEACKIGVERLEQLLEKYGSQTLDAEVEALMDFADRHLRSHFSKIPDGTYSWSDAIDEDPASDSDAELPVHLSVTIKGDKALYDFTGTSPQANGPVNIPLSGCYAAALCTTKAVFPDVPFNEGMMRAIDFVIPESSVVSASFPAPVSGGACAAAEKVVSCVHGCLIQVVPERAMACPANLINICFGGFDPRPQHEENYVMYCWLAGGWGARPGARDNFTSLVPLSSGTKIQPAEFLERAYPVLIEGYGLLQDSEGAGRHRGGFGLSFPIRVTHGESTLSGLSDRGKRLPWGYDGGLEPLGNGMVFQPGTPEEESLGVMCSGFRLQAGEGIDYWQGGGGGWGDPLDRPAEWVLEDVTNELISVERAEQVYGVVIDVGDPEALEFEVNQSRSEELRELKKNERQ